MKTHDQLTGARHLGRAARRVIAREHHSALAAGRPHHLAEQLAAALDGIDDAPAVKLRKALAAYLEA
jgi:hypothetical protein